MIVTVAYHRIFLCLALVALLSKAHALECYICDSAEDAECATRPGQQLNVEECTGADDHCITVIVGSGITRRGCLSRLFPNKYCPEPCEHCNSNLCNRRIFPTNRLRCFQCVGSECIDVVGKNSSYLWPCPVYNEKDRCYTNVIGISNVQRGCEYTNLPPTCPNVCLKCNYDGCNHELGVHEQSCLECSHTALSPNPHCLRNQLYDEHAVGDAHVCALTTGTTTMTPTVKQCTNKLLHGHAGKCFTYINVQTNVVHRGCSTTMGFYPTGALRECYGKNCNRECLTINCNNCSTSAEQTTASNYNCRYGINLRPQMCQPNTFSCYSCEEGTHIRRGCFDTETVLQQKLLQQSKACYHCTSLDGCNRVSVRTCYHCSSLYDGNCALMKQTSSDNDLAQQQNCSSASELCVSTLLTRLNLVYVVRGCAAQIPECTNSDPFCTRCNGSLCNRDAISWHLGNEKIVKQLMLFHIERQQQQHTALARSEAAANKQIHNLINFALNIFLLIKIFRHT